MAQPAKSLAFLLILAGLAGLGWAVKTRLDRQARDLPGARKATAAAVEVARIERGPIELRRLYSGTLEARARFVIAPKVGGRIERIAVDISEPLERGQVVAELDDDEHLQAVKQAQANLEVSKAQIAEAESAVEIAKRELERVQALREKGVATASQLDAVYADQVAKEAAVQVAKAQASRAEAELETTRIRLSYTKVVASWTGGESERVVGERYVNEGDTVSANTPLLAIVELQPIQAVVFATEKDYADLRPGKRAAVMTDAYPGRTFEAEITRIAPVFRQASRQARAELTVQNPDRLLKPGMFIRAEVVLQRVEDATIVPVEALVTRDGKSGVFLVREREKTVRWCPVEVGIRDGERAEVRGEGLEGRVVVLGQQLIDDGSAITIPADAIAREREVAAKAAKGGAAGPAHAETAP